MKNYTSIALIAAILLVVNILAKQFFFRVDLTEDQRYTLSDATENILKSLEDPVTITAYFSEDLPQGIAYVRDEFREMLVEYASLSGGMVEYDFINPSSDVAVKQEAMEKGIQPVLINVREKDQTKQQKAFLGAIIQLGEQTDVIPVMQPGAAMEYALSTGIKKLSVQEKPSIGLVQGHGEASLQNLGQVYQSLSILYNVENVDLNTLENLADRFRAIAIVNPSDSIPPAHFSQLDAYLSNGGKIFIAMDAVSADLSTQSGTPKTTGLETWLKSKGLEVENSFVTDASCGSISVQQRQGFFTYNTPVQFPFLPMVSNFGDHPITKGLEQILLPFASPIRYLGDSTSTFTPIMYSSKKAGIVAAPTTFDVANKDWSNRDFILSDVVLAGVLENVGGNAAAKIVVIGDGEFPITEQGRAKSPDNISLMVNSIDWLSDDTGLIDLRTKGVASRPIDELEDGTRTMLKYLNFGLPIVLILLYGFFRFQRQRSIKMRRMQEQY